MNSDPQHQYVIELQVKIKRALGESSFAFRKTAEWLNQSHCSSQPAWLDYLIKSGIPDAEYDVVERFLDDTPNVWRARESSAFGLTVSPAT